MAQVTVQDLLDDASAQTDQNGTTAVRKFIVSGLTAQASGRMFEALNTVGIPRRGQTHPNLAGIVVKSVAAEPCADSPSKAYVTVSYAAPTYNTQAPSQKGKATYRSGATVSDFETSEDKDKKQMLLTHTQISQDEGGNNVTKVLDPQPAKVVIQKPQAYLSCERPEPLPINYRRLFGFVGCVNSSPFQGFGARCWLCTAIDVDEAGDRGNVSYQFSLKFDTWDARVVYIDPATGAPVKDPEEGKGIKNFRVYKEVDFNQLGI